MSGFEYFLNGFAHTLDQVRPTLDQDRARWALSNEHLIFQKKTFYHKQNPKVPQKLPKKPLNSGKTCRDSPIR